MELVISVLTAIISFTLSLFVYSKNTKSGTHFYFAALLFLIGTYTVFNYLSINAPTPHDAFVWAKFILYSSILTGPSFYFFVKTFPSSDFFFNKKIQFFILTWVTVNIFLASFDLIFASVQIINKSPAITPGPLVASFGLLQVSTLILGSIELIRKYRNAKGITKLQLKYITFGILTGFGFALVSTIIMPMIFNNASLIFISPLYLALTGVLIAYAIIRHRLLDIRFIVARSVAYTLLLTIIGSFYAVDVFIISNYIFKTSIPQAQIVVYVLLALFIAFTFQPLKDALEEATDSLFFKGKYNSNELILILTKIMASTLRLEDLTQKTLHQLLTTVHIERGSFIIFQKDVEPSVIHEGYSHAPEYDKETISQFAGLRKIVLYDEEENESLKELMRKHDCVVILPLFDRESGEGMLLLGEKKSGEIYSPQDVKLLQIFGPEISVAIRNAKSYDEISKFNITLKEEVDKATKDLKIANEQLKELDNLKDEFVSLASHELRTPMTAIKSYLWMALDGRGGKLTEKQEYYLGRAYTSVDRLIRLVNEMLNISRIESGRITISLDAVDLEKVTQEVIDEVLPHAKELGVAVEKATAGSLPQVLADADKIKEVIFNLVGNALKFTPKGGKVMVSFSQKGDMVETTVKDTGTGIEKDNLPKLFQKFGMIADSYTANNVATTAGTGLGLYMCKSIVEMHKGKIWVDSEGKGKGSEFTFSLKAATEKDIKEVRAKGEDKGEGATLIHTEI